MTTKHFACIILLLFSVLKGESQHTMPTAIEDLDLSVGTFNSFTKNKLAVNPAITGYFGDYYFENRYNYEAANSASINVGKKIFKHIRHVAIIPMGGLVFGSFSGITAELQTSIDLSKWSISSDNQFSLEYRVPDKSIYLNWSIVRYKLFQSFHIGITTVLQQSVNSKALFDKGITAALFLNKWSVRFYAYNYQLAKRYYWLGASYNIHLKLRR